MYKVSLVLLLATLALLPALQPEATHSGSAAAMHLLHIAPEPPKHNGEMFADMLRLHALIQDILQPRPAGQQPAPLPNNPPAGDKKHLLNPPPLPPLPN